MVPAGDNRVKFRTISAGVIGWSYLLHQQSTSPMEHASQGGANLQFHVQLVFKKKVLSLLDSPVSGKILLQICFGNTII